MQPGNVTCFLNVYTFGPPTIHPVVQYPTNKLRNHSTVLYGNGVIEQPI